MSHPNIRLVDRAKETTTTTGSGTVSLGGAVAGFVAISGVGNGNSTYYTLEEGNNFEVGIGTYTSAGNTLSRDEVFSSSNSDDSKIDLAGSTTVFITYPADKAVIETSGNYVGIGGIDPEYQLVVSGTGSFNTVRWADGTTQTTAATDTTYTAGTGLTLVGTRFDTSGTGYFDSLGIGTGAIPPTYPLHVAGDMGVDEYIYHNGDGNTFIRFAPDLINLVAGSWSAIKLEKSTGKVQLNNGNHDLDVEIMADDGEVILHTDAGTNNVGIGTVAPSYNLEVSGTGSFNTVRWADGTTQVTSATGDISIVSGLTVTNATNIASTGASNLSLIRSYIDTSDNATFNNVIAQGNLTVSGTLTYLDSTTVTIADKQLELASNSGTPIGGDSAVNDGGIVVKSTDSDKKWTWLDATDAWTSTEHISLNSSKNIIFGDGTEQSTSPTGDISTVSGLTVTNASNIASTGATNATAIATKAPNDAQYVALATDGDLSAERVLTAGSGIRIVDAGANGAVTLHGSGITVTAGSGLEGGGSVALGGTVTLDTAETGWFEKIGINDRTPDAMLDIVSASDSDVGIRIEMTTESEVDPFQIVRSNGVKVSSFDSAGDMNCGAISGSGATFTYGRIDISPTIRAATGANNLNIRNPNSDKDINIDINENAGAINFRDYPNYTDYFHFKMGSDSDGTGLYIRSRDDSSILTQWRSSGGTPVAMVDPTGAISGQHYVFGDGTVQTTASAGGGGGGAPTTAQYVTLATDGSLSQERVLTAGSGVRLTDGGANGPITLGVSGVTITAGSGLIHGGEVDLGSSITIDAVAGTTAQSGIVRLQDSATNGTTDRAITPNAVYDISGVLSTSINTNTTNIASTGATNAAAIVTNTTNIATNTTNIAATGATNAAAAGTNATNISTNTTNIAATGATNAAAAGTNATNIAATGATNAAAAGTNATNIATNTTNIAATGATNAAAAGTNATNIATNTTNIAATGATNAAAAGTNATNISTNTTNIAATGATNAAAAGTNATNISTNTTNIAATGATNAAAAGTNATNISTNTTNIAATGATNAAAAGTNATNIAATGATNAAAAGTNATNISTNTSNIASTGATNATAISTKAPNDAQYVALATDGDLSAERVLTAGSGIRIVDAGANGAVTLHGSGITLGGVAVNLGGSDATPAFDLSDATDYPTSSLDGTITNAQLAGSIANDKLANSTITVTAGTGLSNGGSVALGASVTVDADTASTSQTGIVRLQDSVTDSTTNRAVTPNAVYDMSGVLQSKIDAAGGGGAPTDAQYVTLATDGDLSAERVLARGTGIHIVDGGANGNVTVSVSGSTTSQLGIVQLQDSATDGTVNRAITPNAVYDISGVLQTKIDAGGGGGGSPGGSDTQVQFNDSTSFGGDSDLTWNKTTNVLTVVGHIAATTKSFLIDHPVKENKKLQYASLEGPENGVYVRGHTTSHVIELPDYWEALIDPESITVHLTPKGKPQPSLCVNRVSANKVYLSSDQHVSAYYTVSATRKDVPPLEVEI